MNVFVDFFRKNIIIKIICLLIFIFIIYYFFTAGFRADEGHFMISANYVLLGLRPYLDFRGTHGEIGRYIIASLYKTGIPTEVLIVIYRMLSFMIFFCIIYNLAKLFAKRNDALLFGADGRFYTNTVILISAIISFCLTYSALLPETTMIPLLLLGFYFLIRGGSKNHIIAGMFFALSIVALQKAVFVIPLLYILSLEKEFLKNYKKVLIYRSISGVSIIFFIALYAVIRYRGYTANELWIVYGSLFKLQSILQLPFNLYTFFTGFTGGGINNLFYLFPGIFFLLLSRRKAAITIAGYIMIQLLLLSYVFDVMPLMIVRYFYSFLVLTPIFFRYQWFQKNMTVKYIVVFLVFASAYASMLLSGQWNRLRIHDCEKAYKIFDDNQDKHITMFYDGICFKHSYLYDMNIAGKRLESEKNLLSTFNYDVDIRLAYPNATWERISKLPSYLQERFSAPGTAEKLLGQYDHVYTVFSGCDNVVKIDSYDQMLKDTPYFVPPISCVPFAKKVLDLFPQL